MKRFFRLHRLIAIALLFVCQSLWCLTASESLGQALRSYKTYSANFVQTTHSGNSMAIVQQSGQFYLKRPDLFRWQTIKPNQQIIYGNVQQMIVYDPDLMQATVHPVTPQSWTPAQLLLGDTKMMERYFNVTLIVHNAQSIYYLKAKDKRQAFQSATLMFQDKKLSALNIKSNLDQYSQFRFSNIKINQPIANSFFKFKAKPGVDVIHG